MANQAIFDYNSGKFKLQPIPEQAEVVFLQINTFVYPGVLKADAADTLQGLEKAEVLFDQWLRMVAAGGAGGGAGGGEAGAAAS